MVILYARQTKIFYYMPLLSSTQYDIYSLAIPSGCMQAFMSCTCLSVIHILYSFNSNAEMSVLTFMQRIFFPFCF